MTIGYGVGSSLHHIGPEYGFSFTVDDALREDILVIKWAYGGTDICHDWRPPLVRPYREHARLCRLYAAVCCLST
jgi:hypothetical protein